MTKEEIRQKAIESAKEIAQGCCKPCKECEYGEYFPVNRDVTCLAVNGYECGFADGVEEGKKQMLDEMLAVMHTSEFKDKWADAPLGVTIFDFVAEYFTPKGEKT